MDDSSKQAGNDAMAIVARSFEPARIERQLLAHVFDLVCEAERLGSSSASSLGDCSIAKPSTVGNVERRRVA